MDYASVIVVRHELAKVSERLQKQQHTLYLLVQRLDKALEEEEEDSAPSPRSPSYSPLGSPCPSNNDVICLSDNEEQEPRTTERYVLFFLLSLIA